ncbi:MAG TPA: MFS transporter [Bacteroidota bacterium]|nr:MFS transporter [Bacteroidota bacterium]
MTATKSIVRTPWSWVPSLYFAEGIPYVMVMTVSVIMYKRLGISNTDIALVTSWLYFPWAIKPLWSPFVDMFGTKRRWVVMMQFLISCAFLGIAFTVSLPHFLIITLSVFGLIAFCSATHDIAADGFYMLGLSQQQQSAFVGIRSTLYRLAMITGQGLLVVLAGTFEPHLGIPLAWSITFGATAFLFAALFLYHRWMLPHPAIDHAVLDIHAQNVWKEFVRTFVLFFKRKNIGSILAFLFFYRFAEAQLVKLVQPFLLDAQENGGLGLSTGEVGVTYGTVGIIALVAGGLLGGYAISKKGLKWWLWPMVIIMHFPDLVFVYLSQVQPTNILLINMAVALEQFGYGFGFTAYSMFMIYISHGEYKTAHYAICTGIMALGMMLPGMVSGALQEWLGYKTFFIWVMLSTIPGFIVAGLVSIESEFGKQSSAA